MFVNIASMQIQILQIWVKSVMKILKIQIFQIKIVIFIILQIIMRFYAIYI